MSRIGKKPVAIIPKTEINISADLVTVKGPLGELKMAYDGDAVEIVKDGETVVVKKKNENPQTVLLWGTYASIIENMIAGVNKEFEKNLIIEGVGYKADVAGNKMVLKIGLSHTVELPIPAGIKVKTDKEKISVTGIDKQAVGQFAAVLRSKKKPEPYKGKGIRYSTEVIRRKEGKKNV